MLNLEDWMEIRILHRQGLGIRDIARRLKVSRNTVRKALRAEASPRYRRRVRRASKLDPYQDYLRARMAAAKPDWLPATVLHREIVERGYRGGISLLRAWLRPLKATAAAEPVVRFETAPGEQLQMDWIVFRRGRDRLSAFVATLGYSRASYVEFVSDERLETLLSCHEHAFAAFGGVPRRVLYDNMKTVVLARDYYAEGQHRFQAGLWDFAHHYGFIPKLCRPYRAKTKGKVERFNHYLRHSFYNPLASRLKQGGLVLDAATANVEVRRWLGEVANRRVHATTGRIPAEVLVQEREQLQPLPMPYPGQVLGAVPAANHSQGPGAAHHAVVLQHPLSVYELCVPETTA
jgi:transposase